MTSFSHVTLNGTPVTNVSKEQEKAFFELKEIQRTLDRFIRMNNIKILASDIRKPLESSMFLSAGNLAYMEREISDNIEENKLDDIQGLLKTYEFAISVYITQFGYSKDYARRR